MASAYTPEGSYPDVLIGPGNQVTKVQVVQGSTIPSGTWFSLPILPNTWKTDGGAVEMTTTAQGIEEMLSRQYVTGATYAEDLDDNGLVQSYMNTTITIPTPPGVSGVFSTTIQVPLGILGADFQIMDPVLTQMIDDAVAALEKTVAG